MSTKAEVEAAAQELILEQRKRLAVDATGCEKRAYERSAPLMGEFKAFCDGIREKDEEQRLEKIRAWWRERGIAADFYYKRISTTSGPARVLASRTLWCIEDES